MRAVNTASTQVTAVLAGDAANQCLAVAHRGEAILICPLERWRRRRGSHEVFGRDLVRSAMATLLPEQDIPTCDPELFDVTGDADATTEALLAAARLYAGHQPGHALISRGISGMEWWAFTPESATLTRRIDGPAPDVVIARFAGALGLSHLPPTQVEALGRWGEPLMVDEVHAALEHDGLDALARHLHDADHKRHADAICSVQQVLAARVASLVTNVSHPVVLLGDVFLNSYFTTVVAAALGAPGHDVAIIVPPDPGAGAIAVGGLAARGALSVPPSPFAGPSANVTETKLALDRCKLTYEFLNEAGCVTRATEALRRGRLVAWFEQGMEWGPRALGHRSIFADASNPYVLENLNVYLKKRPAFMSYALSIRASQTAAWVDGPTHSRGMQYQYTAREPGRFAQFLPRATQPFRVHTVDDDGSSIAQLIRAFEVETGLPYLANTSFNAITEPLVATPTDAIRCFFGSGLDLLIMNGLVVTK
jgi:hypothetical protein